MKPINRNLDFFSNNFARRKAGKVSLLGRLHTTFHMVQRKKIGHVNEACNFCNFGHVFPCLVIRGMIMLILLT